MIKKSFIAVFVFAILINTCLFANGIEEKAVDADVSAISFVDYTSGNSLKSDDEKISNALGGISDSFKNPFTGMFKFYGEIIIGVAGGLLMTFRLGIELFHAIIMNDASGSIGEVRKVLMRFLIHLIVAVTGASVVFWVFNIHI